MQKILVTKAFIPPLAEYHAHLEKIWENGQLTNQGPCLTQLEANLKALFHMDNIHCVANGTLAIQLALSSLNIQCGEIITTPFSYVATVSSILWQRCTPVFVDIEPHNFTIDPQKIEQAITKDTKAILAVHVFGYACQVEMIQEIANQYGLKVIYDAAHAFGAKYKNTSLFSYGDIATTSFHATKLFHSCEGGACFFKDAHVADTFDLQKRFGHNFDTHYTLGINAKMSELHAAMGLTILPYLPQILESRKNIAQLYTEKLQHFIQLPKKQQHLEHNYSYYPVVFDSEKTLLHVFEALSKENIFPRRYFYPSLNTLPYVQGGDCPISEDISQRIACLPLEPSLEEESILRICHCIIKVLSKR